MGGSGNDMTEFKPPKTVGVMFYLVMLPFVAMILFFTWDAYVQFNGGYTTGETFRRTFYISLFASIPFTLWMYRKQTINMDMTKAIFRFTRYLVPKRHEIEFADVKFYKFVPGTLATDGRPRPYLEFEMKSGKSFWVPLPVYTNRQIAEMRKMLPQESKPKRRDKR